MGTMISSPAGTMTAVGMSNLPRIFGLFHHDFPVMEYQFRGVRFGAIQHRVGHGRRKTGTTDAALESTGQKLPQEKGVRRAGVF